LGEDEEEEEEEDNRDWFSQLNQNGLFKLFHLLLFAYSLFSYYYFLYCHVQANWSDFIG